MRRFSPIALEQLPPPQVVERLDFETILERKRRALLRLAPEIEDALLYESDPVTKVLQLSAYDEMILRNRINEAGRAVMLATARASDLDHLGALLGVRRLVVDPGDAEARPPRPVVLEGDDALRERVQLAPEGFSTAGPRGAYVFHARAASGEVKDATAIGPSDDLPGGPAPGEVVITVLSRAGSGVPDAALLATVRAGVNGEAVRPLCDTVTVQAAQVTAYAVEARLVIEHGPDPAVVIEEARLAVDAYARASHRLGRRIALTAILAALHRPGVREVRLLSPAADIERDPRQAAFCASIDVREAAA